MKLDETCEILILCGKIHQEGYQNVYGIILDPEFGVFFGLGSIFRFLKQTL